MRYFEILQEETVTINNPEEKMDIAQEVWDILDKSYASLGGFKSFDNMRHMVNTMGMWMVSYDDQGRPNSAIVFKKQYGNKLVGLGTNGTPQAKQELMHNLNDLKNKKNFWAEVSGPLERVFEKMNIPKISNKLAEKLTDKAILDFAEDGFHYTRFLGGQATSKIIVGYPEI